MQVCIFHRKLRLYCVCVMTAYETIQMADLYAYPLKFIQGFYC